MDITENLFGAPKDKESESEPRKSKQDEYFEFALKQVFSREDIEMKTDLTRKQINHFAKGLLYAELFGSDLMKSFCELQMTLLVSVKRGGRKEMQEMIRSSLSYDNEMPISASDRLLGRY